METKNVIAVSIISAIISVLVIFLLLPLISSEFAPYISALELTDANILIGFTGLLVIIATMEISFVLFARSEFKALTKSIIVSFVYSVLFLCIISFLYVGIFRADRLYGVSTLKVILHFFIYPAIVAIDFGSIEIYWLITIVLFVLLFNVKYIREVGLIKGEKTTSKFSKKKKGRF